METGLFLIKVLSNLSLVFMSVNFVYGIIAQVPPWHPILFLWVNLLSVFVYYIKRQAEKRLLIAAFVLAVVPLAFVPLGDIPFIVINYIFAIYVGLTGIKPKKDYGLTVEVFSKGLAAATFITLLLWVFGKNNLLGQNFSLYIFIFLFSSVYLLRSLRHLAYSDRELELSKINLIYGFFTFVIASILASATVRHFLGYVLGRIYEFITGIIIYLASWIALPISYLANLLAGLVNFLGSRVQQINGTSGSNLRPAVQYSRGANSSLLQMVQHILVIAFRGLAIFLLLYGLLRLLRRLNHPDLEVEDYTEYREYIFAPRKRAARSPGILSYFRQRSGSAAIRRYYKQFLKLCLKQEIMISASDTTSEINDKCEMRYDKEILTAIRRIYIRVRYGEEPSDPDIVNEFYSLYKRLR